MEKKTSPTEREKCWSDAVCREKSWMVPENDDKYKMTENNPMLAPINYLCALVKGGLCVLSCPTKLTDFTALYRS